MAGQERDHPLLRAMHSHKLLIELLTTLVKMKDNGKEEYFTVEDNLRRKMEQGKENRQATAEEHCSFLRPLQVKEKREKNPPFLRFFLPSLLSLRLQSKGL
ncbi:hypothetical protein Ancab_002944 [Ancistrocladus abbreviatus]